MPEHHPLRFWRPRGGARVRVRFGKFRGAHGKVRQMRSRFGRTIIELDPDAVARYDQIEVGAWRLGPPRTAAPDVVDLRAASPVDHDVPG